MDMKTPTSWLAHRPRVFILLLLVIMIRRRVIYQCCNRAARALHILMNVCGTVASFRDSPGPQEGLKEEPSQPSPPVSSSVKWGSQLGVSHGQG